MTEMSQVARQLLAGSFRSVSFGVGPTPIGGAYRTAGVDVDRSLWIATVVELRREFGCAPAIREGFGQRDRNPEGGAKPPRAKGGVQR
jgi:hypothetical protein